MQKYRAAISEKFPDLALGSIEYLSEGWDSVACRVNQNLIFRFPKRPEVEQSLKVELRLLPELAPSLPLPIPNFKYVSPEPGQFFEYAFVGYEMINGWSEEDWPEDLLAADWWKVALGQFVTALHRFPLERARELGVQELKDVNLVRVPQQPSDWREALEQFYRAMREQGFPLLSDAKQDEVADFFEDFLDNDDNFKFEPTLVHADLYYDHILLDLEKQKINGIIDFGDVGIGDPAFDVSEAIAPYYSGNLGPNFQERRRFIEGLQPYYAILFGLNYNDPALVEAGLSELGSCKF